MSAERLLLVLLACLASGLSRGQGPAAGSDSIHHLADWRVRHQPLRATVYSAILPGAGQVYNRKYWKVPIVLGGLGACVWFIQDNNKEFQRYKAAYLDVVAGRDDEFHGRYGASQLRNVADTYQRWRDMSYLALGLVYALNIVDATVDGYFVRFDVSDNLSMSAAPSFDLMAQQAVGVRFSFTIH